jgi:hypothetical protein
LATNDTVRPINLDECEKTFLRTTDALNSSWYQVILCSSVYVTALFNVICARHRNRFNYFKTAHKMFPICITVKETGNRERLKKKKKKKNSI